MLAHWVADEALSASTTAAMGILMSDLPLERIWRTVAILERPDLGRSYHPTTLSKQTLRAAQLISRSPCCGHSGG